MDAPTRRRHFSARVEAYQPLHPEAASILKIPTVGIDLAKFVFQGHGIDEYGKAVLRK